MGKGLRRFLIILLCIFGLLIVARLSGLIQVYVIPNAANIPNIQKDQKIIATSLKKPSKGDFIAFINPYSDTLLAFTNRPSVPQYVYRFVANQNDTIQMKHSVLYVNGKNIDEGLNLAHFYQAEKKDVPFLASLDKTMGIDVYSDYRLTENTTIVNISDDVAKKIPSQYEVKKYTQLPDTSQFGAFIWLNKNAAHWTIDDFGPIVVPAKHCFVLGDNRSQALDSRYAGFIKLSNIKGVKL